MKREFRRIVGVTIVPPHHPAFVGLWYPLGSYLITPLGPQWIHVDASHSKLFKTLLSRDVDTRKGEQGAALWIGSVRTSEIILTEAIG